jgi:hypothetical protein
MIGKATDECEPFSCAEVQGLVQEAIDGTTLQDKFKDGNVSRQHAQMWRERKSLFSGGGCFTSDPQTTSHLRAEWTTFANIQDYFDIVLKALTEIANQIAVINPECATATKEQKESGAVDRMLVRLPGQMGCMDEMPLTLNVHRVKVQERQKVWRVLHRHRRCD